MAVKLNRLTPRAVEIESKVGRHADGGGLYLVVDKSGSKRWVFLYRWKTKLTEMGLGATHAVPLAGRKDDPRKGAREMAAEARNLLAQGISPLQAKRDRLAREANIITFGAYSEAFLGRKKKGWSDRHFHAVETMLATYVGPIAEKDIATLTPRDVENALRPVWETAPVVADRLRGRIEEIIQDAINKGLRSGENPAIIGKLSLPDRKDRGTPHFKAMAYQDVPAFVARLHDRPGISVKALEFLILTAARSGEVFSAEPADFDLENAIWKLPAEKTKARREHRVPLSPRAVEIVREMMRTKATFVFHGQTLRSRLAPSMMHLTVNRMEVDATVHGFRSAFRDWAGDMTEAPREVAEAALAHKVGSATELSYRRGDALRKRRLLMDAWADYCAGTEASNVIRLAG